MHHPSKGHFIITHHARINVFTMATTKLLEYAIDRILAFLDEIAKLKESEFSYKDSEKALDEIDRIFKSYIDILNKYDSSFDEGGIKQTYSQSLRDLFIYLPILGFILRSTNVRNAFETYGPLRRLARNILEPEKPLKDRSTKLILSSEWNYSPYMYPEFTDLPGYVFIGLPSCESSNPLLVPLSGHELGHFYWGKYNLAENYTTLIFDSIITIIINRWKEYNNIFPKISDQSMLFTDLFASTTWEQSKYWAMRHSEEIFCDFIGLRIFGVSFLHSLAYLLSPKIRGPRHPEYPNMLNRIGYLIDAAKKYGITCPSNYKNLFENSPEPPLSDEDGFRLSIADEADALLINELMEKADEVVAAAEISSSKGEEDRILNRFEKVVPTEKCNSIVDILNAAWRVYHDQKFWRNNENIFKNKNTILKELVLKNIEVFEVEQILKLSK